MADVPIKAIIGENGEVQYVPFTPEEIEQRELDAIAWATEKAEREAEVARVDALKASAKQKLISGQPLTEEEASVIVI
jgi:hypothetical protein